MELGRGWSCVAVAFLLLGELVLAKKGGRENGKHLQGVGLLLSRHTSDALLGYDCINERFLTAKFKTKIKDLNVICCYASTKDSDENEKDTFYSQLQDILNSVKKGYISLVLGDFNAKVGTDSDLWAGVLGPFGIGSSNGNGERLLQPPLLDQVSYKTTYACEGKELQIFCDDGIIHLIRANYGRFSISICNDHGNLDWRVNCMSYRSFLIMQDRCNLKPNCSVNVSSGTFGDPCPGTLKYLEVQYHCGSDMPLFTTQMPSLSPVLKALLPMNTTLPLQENKTQTFVLSSTTSTVPMSTAPTLSSVMRPSPSTPVMHLFPTSVMFSESSTFSAANSTQKSTHMQSKFPVSTFKPSTTATTTFYPNDNYCPPMFSRDIFWNWTKAGETAVQKCPGGATGLAKWSCKSHPVRWFSESPDLKECRSLWLENIKERMQEGDSIIIRVATELALMTLTKSLFGEDLKEISELIQQTLYKAVNSMENFLDMWHRYHVLRELLQSLVQTISNLLDESQKSAWTDLSKTERRSVMSSVMEGLEESALLLAETSSLDGSFSLVKNNVLLSLKVVETKALTNIQFPNFEEAEIETEGTYWASMQDNLLLPMQALQEYSRHGLVKVVFTAFSNAEEFLRPGSVILHHPRDHPSDNVTRIVNSRIVSASLERSGNPRLVQPVLVTLKHLKEENVTEPVCVFWDFHSREWSARGCWVDTSNRTHTVCACDHLTNFAVVMELKSPVVLPLELEVLHMIISIGCIIAVVCLLITVVVLNVLRNVTGDSVIIHRNMFMCLLISEVVFVGGIDQTQHHIACAIVAGLLQYFFLAAFAWMFFECYQQYVILIEVCDTDKSRARWYYAVSYVVPGIIVGVAAIVDPSSYGTQKYCWLQADNYFVFSFVGPAVGILFGGVVFLCIAMCIFCHHSSITTAIKGKEEAKLANIKSWIRRSVVLLFLVSLTWTSGLLYINKETVFLAYAFSVLNGMQGIVALILYCLRNEKVQQELKKILRNQQMFSSCLQRKQKDQEPQHTAQLPPSGTAPGEHISQQYWNLTKDKSSISSPKCTTPGPLSMAAISSPEGDVSQDVTSNGRTSNKWEVVTNSQWQTRIYNSGEEGLRDDSSTATLPADWQPTGQHQYHPQYRHFSVASDSNSQFVDHIYETIDDEPAGVEYQQQVYAPQQQFPPAENYYGDHSDLSQHSSSSYGYDQRPLLIGAAPTRHQTTSQPSYSISKDYSGSPSPEGKHQQKSEKIYDTQGRRYKNRETVNIERTFPVSQPVYDGASSDTMSGTQTHSAKDSDHESWGPSLPDLLQCPVDSAVVLAVLDGEKVVSRLQQDDTQCQPQYKLSTYC